MNKTLDLTKNVHDLCTEYPEVKQIMADLGFSQITKPGMLASIGRMMTIPKGAKMQHIDMADIIKTFEDNGFSVTGAGTADDASKADSAQPQDAKETEEDAKVRRQKLLQSYVSRLSDGEDLESVRADFVKNFKDVDAAEIAQAEQTLIQAGTPVEKVQKLCDVHSALFHGATQEEKIANAEAQVMASLNGKKPAPVKRKDGGDTAYLRLSMTIGHPLQIFHKENKAIKKQFDVLRKAVASKENVQAELDKARQVAVHYAKKGDLIYPILKTKYDFSGPSDVMWGVDDEIRDEMKKLSRELEAHPEKMDDKAWRDRLDAVLTRAEEMVYKEENILFPLCAKNFTKEDWQQIAYDHQDYEFCLIDPVPVWKEAANFAQRPAKAEKLADAKKTEQPADAEHNVADKLLQFMKSEGLLNDGGSSEIHLASGSFTPAQLDAMLNTIPMELTFIDDKDINRYFNQNDGPKLFKRPLAALGREVYSCHPPKVQPIVQGVIAELKNGKKDSVDIWNERGGEPVYIRYMAVRDKDGNYVGTLECVQHMGFAKEHFSK